MEQLVRKSSICLVVLILAATWPLACTRRADAPAESGAPAGAPSAGASSSAAPPGSADPATAGGPVARGGRYEVRPVGQGGTLQVLATYAGDPLPERLPVEVSANREFCGGKVLDEAVIVDPETRGLANVAVRLEGIQRGKAPPAEILISNKHCSFVPHVQVAMAGTLVKARNDDPISHTTHPYYEVGTFFNFPFSREGEEFPGKKIARTGVISVKCDVHSWMQAYIVVHDSPYIGVTDAKGALAIGDVPAGTYPYVAWHEKLGEQRGEVTMSSGEVSELRLALAPGT